ncbi:hypothetical protein HAV22_06805 [Massilia sp. TW-1]|uniref:Curlin associated repeat-containing protein n=1 Tax=Telluria antibiotica TaxID=2717319 RepID=A0ABX0P7U7_9BURK|nr:hypothetical protein [Telluria antibiotica]NIA53361.1 hypothetical protein [Telluria antibiotica]
MKAPLSSIIIGVGLACACHVVAAGPSITITQQGNGNTTAAEQSDLPNGDTGVTITQIGDNNHVGGPGASGPGVIQRDLFQGYDWTLRIYQNGTNNNASVVQDTVHELSVEASVEQTGSGNSATVRQENVNGPLIEVKQNGTGNRSDVKQVAVMDSSIWTTQNGIGNSAAVSEHNSGPFFGSRVVQNGEGNTASVMAEQASFCSPVIQQDGYRNDARASQTNINEGAMLFQQQGSANLADGTQTGYGHTVSIDQNGIGNAARTAQSGGVGIFTGNSAVIAQIGDANSATLRQQGDVYAANLRQTGSGNWTSVYQH